jgi:hypothetical protein
MKCEVRGFRLGEDLHCILLGYDATLNGVVVQKIRF